MESLPTSNGEDPPDDKCGECARIPPKLPFSKFVLQYEQRVFRFICLRVRHYHDALDLTQETFKKVWENYHRLEAERDPWPWLCKIAFNTINDSFRAKKARKRSVAMEMLSDVADYRDDPATLASNMEVSHDVRAAIDKLSDGDRLLIQLVYFERMTISKVAERLGKSQSATNSALHRARERLKRIMERDQPVGSDCKPTSFIDGGTK